MSALEPRTQAILFKKILAFNRSLGGTSVCIWVAHGHDGQAAASAIALAFRSVGIEAYARSVGETFDSSLPSCPVAYVFPDVADALAPYAAEGVALISGFVEVKSKVAAVVGKRANDRPGIWISRSQSQIARVEWDAVLLTLARVEP